MEGGETGLELNLPGYLSISSGSDPAYRNVFTGQGSNGVYWLNDFNAYKEVAAAYQVTASGDQPGIGFLPIYFFKGTVRYVREIQE